MTAMRLKAQQMPTCCNEGVANIFAPALAGLCYGTPMWTGTRFAGACVQRAWFADVRHVLSSCLPWVSTRRGEESAFKGCSVCNHPSSPPKCRAHCRLHREPNCLSWLPNTTSPMSGRTADSASVSVPIRMTQGRRFLGQHVGDHESCGHVLSGSANHSTVSLLFWGRERGWGRGVGGKSGRCSVIGKRAVPPPQLCRWPQAGYAWLQPRCANHDAQLSVVLRGGGGGLQKMTTGFNDQCPSGRQDEAPGRTSRWAVLLAALYFCMDTVSEVRPSSENSWGSPRLLVLSSFEHFCCGLSSRFAPQKRAPRQTGHGNAMQFL